MVVEFVKVHACGNDFLIVEGLVLSEEQERALAIALCARNTGVGADGVEFLQPKGSARSGTLRLRNADGGVAEISGNGTRCVAAWMAHVEEARAGESFTLRTDAGERTCTLVSRGAARMELRSSMGVPTVEPAEVSLDEDAVLVEGALVSTGNPHFVIRVEDDSFGVAGMDWQAVGSAICVHPRFPAQTNVEFVRVVAPDAIEIRIFERGVGPTSSSGTGTCASAAAAMRLYGCDRQLTVHAPGGSQSVRWLDDAAEMELTGPAELIARGEFFWPGSPGKDMKDMTEKRA